MTDVLAIWDMEEDDPSAPLWSRALKKELRSHGVHARIEEVYVPHDKTEEFDISGKLDMMEADGYEADLIIAGGDMNLHMLYDSPDTRLREIPAVSFGAFFPTLADKGRHPNIGIIKDTVDITHNLELMSILWPETRQYVTDIDWTQCSYDNALRDRIDRSASVLDTTAFINNVKIRYGDKQLDSIMESHPDARSLTALSLWNPWINISTETKSRIYPQYAFVPSESHNRVIFYKDDKTTRQMTEDKSFMSFCTAIPQHFEVCDSCAGGYMTPIDIAMKQVATMSEMMLSGSGRNLYSILYLAKDYYLDWNVLRGKHDLGDIPAYIQVRNTNIKDRDAGVWGIIIALFAIVVTGMAALLLYLISKQTNKRRSIKRSMLSSARESIRIKEEFDFIRKESHIHIWSIKDGVFICEEPFFEIKVSEIPKGLFDDFYHKKLLDFLNDDTPGRHLIQIYGRSPVTGIKGWMEIRMAVKETEKGLRKTGITADIDDVKMAEAQLIETRRRLANAMERDSFISSISHEMRTPLNSILGFSQVITDPYLASNVEERMVMRNAVVNNGDEITNIINNILALTRIENGAVQMTMEDCKVIRLLEEVCWDMEVKAASSEVLLEQDGGPEESTIHVDKLIFKIIVQNVIGNAIKFSHPGGRVSVSWEDCMDYVSVNVSDQGIGIDKSNQSLIFSRFYKVDQFSQGVGLGLSIAWEYMTRMGGSISLESRLGKGSTFHLAFPKTGKEVQL